MDFRNATDLDDARLELLCLRHTWPYRHDHLTVRVRYSRGAEFSGTCYYATARLYVNLGRRNKYPYLLGTHVARSVSNRRYWWRETYRLVIADAYQLALFVYLHELYHYLVKSAGRNPRRKESLCDRFATRALVDGHGATVLDAAGRPVPRSHWDFRDVHAFVAAAPKVATAGNPPAPPARPIPVRIWGVCTGTRRS
ncbi:MAG: hypothetical protein AB1716_11875 [Planctomycetota bacterium]